MSAETNRIKIRTMRFTLLFSVTLMGIKFLAWYLTNSNAILTDALESIINVMAGAFALFSIYFASIPKDENHPYGHGKIEFVSAGFEGALIFIAGISIIGKAIYGFIYPPAIKSLDIGAMLAGVAGLFNFIVGNYLVRRGKKFHSALMIADGKHLVSDTISSVGLVIGLVVIYFTKLTALDNVIAIIFGAFILFTGYKLIRESVNNLLDEADREKLGALVNILNANRRVKWIDMHNLRAQKFGPHLHVDAHLTLPWYDTLEETHKEVHAVEQLIRENLEGEVEFFIHSDPCAPPQSCQVCSLGTCPVRKADFVKRLDWSLENMLPDRKHKL
ncbi:MAG TPA: cation diffusion facilitator family transporter [Bacteroidia bacterium]